MVAAALSGHRAGVAKRAKDDERVLLCEGTHGLLLFGPTDSFHWTN